MARKEQEVSSQSLPIKEADDSAVDDRSVATIGYVGETFEQHFAAVRGAAMQNKYWVSVSPDHLQSCNARESPGHAVYIKYNIVMDPDSTARFPVLNSPHVTIMYQCPCEDLAVLWQAKARASTLLTPRWVGACFGSYGASNLLLQENCELHVLLRMLRWRFVELLGEELTSAGDANGPQEHEMGMPAFNFHVTWNPL